MLVASGPTVPASVLAGRSLPDRRSCPFRSVFPALRPSDRRNGDRPWNPIWGKPAMGPVRRLVRLRKSPSVRPAVPTVSLLPSAWLPSSLAALGPLAAVPCGVSVRPPEAGLSSLRPDRGDPVNDCAPLTASAVRQVSVPKNFTRRVFRRCCGHRCRFSRFEFPISFRGLLLKKPGNSRRSTRGSCAPRPSRASGNCGSFPQLAANAVDNAG
jgi:hypothetical protein